MSYVIYNTETKRRHGPAHTLERVAKAVLTKAKKAGKLDDKWVVASLEVWAVNDKMITVKSIMNGAEVQIRESDRGSRACDPSMEGYWTL